MKVNSKYKLAFFSSFIIILIGGLLISFFKNSYAITPGIVNNNLPTNDFTTNYSSNTINNYLKDALNSSSTYNEYYKNFEVASNLKTNNNSHPLYSLMKNLTFPKTTESIKLLDDNPTDITDKGILYIISQGYNTTNKNNIFSRKEYGEVASDNIKQYITQIAIWLYLYENNNTTYCIDTGAGIDACDFYSGNNTLLNIESVKSVIKTAASNQNYNYLNYILKLVDEAKNYKEEVSLLSTINYDNSYIIGNDEKYIETNLITPTVQSNSKNFMYYSLEIKDPNNYGAYFVNSKNEKITNTDNFTGSFKIYIPVKENIDKIDLSSVEVNIYGYFTKLIGYNYRITSSSVTSENSVDNLMNNYGGNKYQKYSNLALGYTPYEIVKTSFKLSNFVKVSKLDITNSEELPGATLEITNKNDNLKKWVWKSTDKPYYIYLENGEYKLCETLAPTGYTLNTNCVDFIVDNNNIKAVQLFNEKEIIVPNTASKISKIFYIIGGLLVFIGIVTFGFVYTYKKLKK